MKKFTLLMVIGLLLLSVSAVWADTPTYTEVWDGRGTDSERCGLVGEGGRTDAGWIHWIFSTKGDSTDALLTLGGNGSGTYSPAEPLNAETWHFFTPFFDLDGLTATIELFGGLPADGGGLVISDFCPGGYEELDVSKTADTSFIRTHDWSIAKSVDPTAFYLYVDGSGDGTATWTIDVTYEGYVDSDYAVEGDITIENTGTLDAVITSVDDVLGGISISVDCGVSFPYTLFVGETLTCSYLEDGYFVGFNEVTVTTERDVYDDSVALVWGDPTSEVNATVTVVDTSDINGEVILGTVDAPNNDQFTYMEDFAWADYGQQDCGDHTYYNTAEVIGDNAVVLDFDTAQLDVYVQCMIFEGETAWAANGDIALQLPYNPDDKKNWATYVEYAEKTTTLFAGRNIPVGSVSFSAVVGGEVLITVNLSGDWEFEDVTENLKVQDYEFAPSGNPSPGLFAHKQDCDPALNTCDITVPANNFYGVHVEVGQWIPDPDFGP
jgi:hypothetical protein